MSEYEKAITLTPEQRKPYETWAGMAVGVRRMVEHTEALLREARAEAWDEGADAAHYNPEIRGFVATGDNPYLLTTTPALTPAHPSEEADRG